MSFAQFQYTLQADDVAELRSWAPKLDGRAEAAAGAHRRHIRSAGRRPRDQGRDRSRDGGALRRDAGRHRRDALRRLRRSGRCRRSTRPRTSTTSSWNWRRAISQDPYSLEQHLCQHLGRDRRAEPPSTNATSGPSPAPRRALDTIDVRQVPRRATRRPIRSPRAAAAARRAAPPSAPAAATMMPLSAFARSRDRRRRPCRSTTRARPPRRRSRSISRRARTLGDATAAIEQAVADIASPTSIHGTLRRLGRASSQSLIGNQPLLIGAALLAVYIVLGVLYESYVHPLTILSTLPSAGVGRRAGADAGRHRISRHRADRRVPADRHRQEERDHDHRLRARGRARRRAAAGRRRASRPACCAFGRS